MNTGAEFVHTASLRLMSVCKHAIHECLWERSEDFALPLQMKRPVRMKTLFALKDIAARARPLLKPCSGLGTHHADDML